MELCSNMCMHALKVIATELLSSRSMSRAVSSASKAVSKGTVLGSSKFSLSTSEAAHTISAGAKSLFSEDDSHTIQVKSKLKSHPNFKDAKQNQLAIEAKRLTSEEELYKDFSHLLEEPEEHVLKDGTKFEEGDYVSPEERQAAKEKEQWRFDKLSRLTLTICLQDITPDGGLEKDRVTITLANFMAMDFSGKHVAILVENVLLEWNDRSIVIPRRVTTDDVFIFKDTVKKDGQYFSELATVRPQLDEEPKLFDEEHEVLCKGLQMKKEIISKIIGVIVKYNCRCYYNVMARNCQHFVKDILKAAEIKEAQFSAEGKEYLDHLRERRLRVPMSFKNHEDIDAYVMKMDSRKELNKLNDTELSYLMKAYGEHHAGEECDKEACKYYLLLEALSRRR